MSIEKIGVVGAGTMGAGIVQVCAGSGFEVVVREPTQELVDAGIDRVEKGVARWLKKEIIDETQAQEIRSRVTGTTRLEDLFGVDFVVEAIIENEDAKRDVFMALDAGCPSATILSSNTSSISITRLAASTGRADKVIGMHFFNPVPLMALVEVVLGESTSEATVDAVVDLAKKLDKTPVTVADMPGFVSNRVLMPMINEAIYCLYEGVASAENIDQVMKLGMAHPMGPLTLADLIGLDVCLAIMEVLYHGYSDSKYRPCPLLRRMVDAGHLGRKTGRGFYTY
jgi:3-hydroxybutyryl-CoA dehydrogenase